MVRSLSPGQGGFASVALGQENRYSILPGPGQSFRRSHRGDGNGGIFECFSNASRELQRVVTVAVDADGVCYDGNIGSLPGADSSGLKHSHDLIDRTIDLRDNGSVVRAWRE